MPEKKTCPWVGCGKPVRKDKLYCRQHRCDVDGCTAPTMFTKRMICGYHFEHLEEVAA